MAEEVSEETWQATLQEVAWQTVQLAGPPDSEEEGGWVGVGGGAAAGAPPEAVGATQWPDQQWHVAFEILFCLVPRSLAALRPQRDDLLLFVYNTGAGAPPAAAAARKGGGAAPPPLFFARRRGAVGLPEELGVGGARAGEVDWRASVLLNVVLQTAYCLSVASCPRSELDGLLSEDDAWWHRGRGAGSGGGDDSGSGSSSRSRHSVFALPSRVPLRLDALRAGGCAEPRPCYPDIAFAVDDFEEAFESLVLARPDDCYVVLLHADVAHSWRGSGSGSGGGVDAGGADAAAARLAAVSLSGDRGVGSGRGAPAGALPAAEVLLFSGFVEHSQLAGALGGRPLAALRGLLGDGRRPQRVQMKGPGGLGAADVAVTSLPAAVAGGAARSPLSTMLQQAAQAARGAGSPAAGPGSLRCALMELSLPVEVLVLAVLRPLCPAGWPFMCCG